MKKQVSLKLYKEAEAEIEVIKSLAPARNRNHAIELAIAHYAQWLTSQQPMHCEVCGTELDRIEMPVRWMYRCDCE